jgi:hypothetical protein
MDIAGHVSKRMLRHYSHIRMEAKRTALESIVKKQTNGDADQTENSRSANSGKTVGYPHRDRGYRNGRVVKSEPIVHCPELPTMAQHFEGEYPQKSPQLVVSEVHRGAVRNRKSKKIIGSSGRTRINTQTYFQQHAGQRMTPKTMQSSRDQINRAEIERGIRSIQRRFRVPILGIPLNARSMSELA